MVLAARQVPGEVPKNEPLFPPPVGVKPNLENNFNTPPDQINQNSADSSNESGQQNISNSESGQATDQATSNLPKKVVVTNGGLKLFFLGLIFLTIILVGVLLFRKREVK